jgi:hypothetical protein
MLILGAHTRGTCPGTDTWATGDGEQGTPPLSPAVMGL